MYTPRQTHLGCWVVSHDPLDLVLVCCAVLLEEIVGIGLCWRVWVGVVEKVLDTEENLLNRNRWLPSFLLVQNGQADGSRGVDVWVEEWGNEFACAR